MKDISNRFIFLDTCICHNVTVIIFYSARILFSQFCQFFIGWGITISLNCVHFKGFDSTKT